MNISYRDRVKDTNRTGRRLAAMRVALCMLLAVAFLLSGPCGALAATYEGEGFASPEDAVQAYLTGIQNEDLSQMLSAFAIESFVEHYDLKAMLEQIRAYTYSMAIKLPNTNEIFESINVEARKGEIVQAIQFQLMSFHMPELDITQPVTFAGDDSAEAIATFLEAFEANTRTLTIKGLQFDAFIAPETLNELYLSEQNQKNLAKRAPVYGADEIKSVVASLTVEGKPYVLCCDAIRYGDAWYLLSLGGNISQLLGLSMFSGGLVPLPM